jgi:hypothetical protein
MQTEPGQSLGGPVMQQERKRFLLGQTSLIFFVKERFMMDRILDIIRSFLQTLTNQ